MSESIRIGPETVGAADVLEYAEALIEQFGWRQGGRSGEGGSVYDACVKEGFSLHDAIGAACERLSVVVGEETAPSSRRSSGDKEFSYSGTTPQGDKISGSIRTEATEKVFAAIAKRTGDDTLSDVTFNDKAQSKDDVIAVLREARKES